MDGGKALLEQGERRRHLFREARAWAQGDVDPKTAALLLDLVDAEDLGALVDACEPPLAFGTAGLRGEVGPGPARMNLATVGQASWALGEFLRHAHIHDPSVVVGFDARPDSQKFAEFCAGVLGGLGINVLLSESPVPTPFIAYAARQLEASAAVVVTASHNPRPDNGLKVFDHHGVQIITPWDAEIARRMKEAPMARALLLDSSRVEVLPEELLSRYLDDCGASARRLVPLRPPKKEKLRLAYTPLHGVGYRFSEQVLLELVDSIELVPVPEQMEPDGAFPTLPFPNPEEPGALDLLLDCAAKCLATAACAHDPDADRFSLCLPMEKGGPPVPLSGDALGLLLSDLCYRAADVPGGTVISTVVSSPALEGLALLRKGRVRRTLTGFKWLCHAALEEDNFLFAYEEALGYCFAAAPNRGAALDKDGILTLLVVARLLVEAGSGWQLFERLLCLYEQLGLWGSFGISRRFDRGASAEMDELLASLRTKTPARMAGFSVSGFTDYTQNAGSRSWALGVTDLLQFDLVAHDASATITEGRLLLRPSGTEAKLKAYVHLRSNFGEHQDYQKLSLEQRRVAEELAAEVLYPPAS